MQVISNLAVITRTLNQKRLGKVMDVLYRIISTVLHFNPVVAATHLSRNEQFQKINEDLHFAKKHRSKLAAKYRFVWKMRYTSDTPQFSNPIRFVS